MPHSPMDKYSLLEPDFQAWQIIVRILGLECAKDSQDPHIRYCLPLDKFLLIDTSWPFCIVCVTISSTVQHSILESQVLNKG